jgi:hypothetical protein
LLDAHATVDQVWAKPTLFDTVAHHKDQYAQVTPGKLFGKPQFIGNSVLSGVHDVLGLIGFIDDFSTEDK